MSLLLLLVFFPMHALRKAASDRTLSNMWYHREHRRRRLEDPTRCTPCAGNSFTVVCVAPQPRMVDSCLVPRERAAEASEEIVERVTKHYAHVIKPIH
jgi:cytochrome c-type biogenesis protein CcmH/NrfF